MAVLAGNEAAEGLRADLVIVSEVIHSIEL
jgi:hypothetical protein